MKWHFRQPVEYLRHVGALDESDPRRLSVVIPNYVYSMNNCLASSSFFSVCCTNKCERLMEVVAALPSDFVDAPRELPASMLSRLREIGDLHRNGEVPLHSRLFAQWMHHAYPQECPFPHSVRGQSTLTPEDWSAQTGLEHSLDRAELAQHAETDFHYEDRGSDVVPWSQKEELVSFHWESLQPEHGGHSRWRKWMA